MKIYISGPFDNKGYVRLFMEELRKRGHEITFDWTAVPTIDKNNYEYNNNAKAAFDGISQCDTLIAVFNNPKYMGRGIFTEIGIALGMGKKVIIYNQENMVNLTFLNSDRIETNIYYHLGPNVSVFSNWADIRNQLI